MALVKKLYYKLKKHIIRTIGIEGIMTILQVVMVSVIGLIGARILPIIFIEPAIIIIGGLLSINTAYDISRFTLAKIIEFFSISALTSSLIIFLFGRNLASFLLTLFIYLIVFSRKRFGIFIMIIFVITDICFLSDSGNSFVYPFLYPIFVLISLITGAVVGVLVSKIITFPPKYIVEKAGKSFKRQVVTSITNIFTSAPDVDSMLEAEYKRLIRVMGVHIKLKSTSAVQKKLLSDIITSASKIYFYISALKRDNISITADQKNLMLERNLIIGSNVKFKENISDPQKYGYIDLLCREWENLNGEIAQWGNEYE